MSDETTNSDHVLLGLVELYDAKRLRSLLEEKGIHIVLVGLGEKPEHKGGQVKVEVYAHESDVAAVAAFLADERSKLLEGLQAPEMAAEATFDTEKDTAVCPACGTSFSTTLKECPDCGLVFMPEGAAE